MHIGEKQMWVLCLTTHYRQKFENISSKIKQMDDECNFYKAKQINAAHIEI